LSGPDAVDSKKACFSKKKCTVLANYRLYSTNDIHCLCSRTKKRFLHSLWRNRRL